MDIERRMMMIRIIDKMNTYTQYSQKLCLENTSRFHGQLLTQEPVMIQKSEEIT